MLLKQVHIVAHEPARPQADWGERISNVGPGVKGGRRGDLRRLAVLD
jgi:hypothetical protein